MERGIEHAPVQMYIIAQEESPASKMKETANIRASALRKNFSLNQGSSAATDDGNS